MTGEISIGGVFVPTLLLLAILALIVTGLVSRLFANLALYRLVAYRPLVDVALFVLILGALSLAASIVGFTV